MEVAGEVLCALLLLPSKDGHSLVSVLVKLAERSGGDGDRCPEWAVSTATQLLADLARCSPEGAAEVERWRYAVRGGSGASGVAGGWCPIAPAESLEAAKVERASAVLESLKRPSCLRCESAWDGYHIGYRCYTCAKSEHSCICVECFDAGEHEGHDYRLFQSQSGGCCDCGDEMAWKSSGFCRNHSPDTPIDMAAMLAPEATEAVCSVLKSLVWVLVWALKQIAARDAIPTRDSALAAHVVLARVHELSRLNDGFRVLVCNELLRPQAMVPLAEFDGGADGCALTALFGYVGYNLPDQMLETLGFFYIKCLLHPPFKQAFTRCFVRSYSAMVDTMLAQPAVQHSPVSKFLDLLSCQLFHNADHVEQLVDDEKLLHKLLGKLDKFMRVQSDPRVLATATSVFAPLPWRQELEAMEIDHHESGPAEGWEPPLAQMEMQIRVISTRLAADELTFEQDAELRCQLAELEKQRAASDDLVVNCEERRVNEQLFVRMCSDIRSIITHKNVAQRVVLQPELLQLLTRIFAGLQAANAHTREVDRHVAYESRGWQYAFILEFEVTGVLKPVLHAFGEAGAPLHVSRAAILRGAELLLQWRACRVAGCQREGDASDQLVSLQDHKMHLGTFKVSRDPVSFHLTLHRCIASFVFETAYRHRAEGLDLAALWCLDALPASFFVFFVDYPIRTQVLCSQIESNRWVRNGAFAMAHQVSLYRNRLWHEMGMDLDFFIMQCGAQILGNAFVALALHRFELSEFWLDTSPGYFREDNYEIATDFICLMVAIGRDRTRVGLTKDNALRRELICWLGVSDMSYSQALDKIHPRFASNTDYIDKVLADVADFHEPHDEDGSGYYSLKESAWSEVDLLFPRLSKGDRNKLEERLAKRELPACIKNLDLGSTWRTFDTLPHRLYQSCILHRIIFSVCLKVARLCTEATEALPSLIPMLNYALQGLLYGIICTDAAADGIQPPVSPGLEPSPVAIGADAMVVNNAIANTQVAIDVGDGTVCTLLSLLIELKSSPHVPHESNCMTVDLILDELAKRSPECAFEISRTHTGSSERPGVDGYSAGSGHTEQDERKRVAQARQAAILAQFSQQQQAFMMDLTSSSEESDEGVDEGQSTLMDGISDTSATGIAATDDEVAACQESFECVLCRGQSESPMARVVTVQASKLLVRTTEPSTLLDTATSMQADTPTTTATAQSEPESDISTIAETHDQCQVHIQSCGHTVHCGCLKRYQQAMMSQEMDAVHGAGHDTLLNFAAGEFSCPVCRRLSNAALPIIGKCHPCVSGSLSAVEREAIIEFVDIARQRSGLPATVSIDNMAVKLLHNVLWLTEVSSRDCGPGELWADGNRACLVELVLAMQKLVAPEDVVESAYTGPPDVTNELLPQFVTACLRSTLSASRQAFVTACEQFYTVAVAQAVLRLLPCVQPLVVSKVATLPWIVAAIEHIPIDELRNGWCFIQGSAAENTSVTDTVTFVDAVSDMCTPLLRQLVIMGTLRKFEGMHLPSAGTNAVVMLDMLQLPSVSAVLHLELPAFRPEYRDLSMVVARMKESTGRVVQRQPASRPFKLIELPELYVTLLLRYQDSVCSCCGEIPKEPALCLRCGSLLCFKKSDGSGECTAHASACCGDVAAFLVLRACAVVLLMGHGRQCLWGSLYLDAHGEQDAYLQRGKTLYLQANKYRTLGQALVSHSLLTNTKMMASSRASRHVHGNPA